MYERSCKRYHFECDREADAFGRVRRCADGFHAVDVVAS